MAVVTYKVDGGFEQGLQKVFETLYKNHLRRHVDKQIHITTFLIISTRCGAKQGKSGDTEIVLNTVSILLQQGYALISVAHTRLP